MAKTQIRYCRRCMNYTEQTYKGKAVKSQFEKEFDRAAAIATLGAYLLVAKVSDDRPKFWKCSRCGNICESHL